MKVTAHLEVEGLVQLDLQDTADCRILSLHHTWRSDNVLDADAEPQIKPIELDITQLFAGNVDTIIEFADRLKLNIYNKKSMTSIDEAIKHIQFEDNNHQYKWIILGVGVGLAVIIIIVVACLCINMWHPELKYPLRQSYIRLKW